jgi:hypothetical protein
MFSKYPIFIHDMNDVRERADIGHQPLQALHHPNFYLIYDY